MNPRPRDLPLAMIGPDDRPPRAPRGFVRIVIAGTSHMARRHDPFTLCHRPASQHESHARPLAICLTCAAAIAELTP